MAMSDAERDEILERLAAAAELINDHLARDDAPPDEPPLRGWVGRYVDPWIDRRAILPAVLAGLITFTGVGLTFRDDMRDLKRDRDTMKAELVELKGRDTTSLAAKVADAINSATQNAGEIRRVEQDSRERDKGLHEYIDDKMAGHERWAHKGRGAALFSWPPDLPVISAAQADER